MACPTTQITPLTMSCSIRAFQQVKKPDIVLQEALRVGRKVIVGFPNFAHYQARFQIFFQGKTPVTPSLPYEWYDTPNLHFLSILDFIEYCRRRKIKIEDSAFMGKNGIIKIFPNLFALVAIFLISPSMSGRRSKGTSVLERHPTTEEGLPEVEKFVSRLRLFLPAKNMEGVELLVCYSPRMTHSSRSGDRRRGWSCLPFLLFFSSLFPRTSLSWR